MDDQTEDKGYVDDPDAEYFSQLLTLKDAGYDVEDRLQALSDKRTAEHREFAQLARAAGHPLGGVTAANVVTEDPHTAEARSERLAGAKVTRFDARDIPPLP